MSSGRLSGGVAPAQPPANYCSPSGTNSNSRNDAVVRLAFFSSHSLLSRAVVAGTATSGSLNSFDRRSTVFSGISLCAVLPSVRYLDRSSMVPRSTGLSSSTVTLCSDLDGFEYFS